MLQELETTNEIDEESMADCRRCNDWRHARFLRLWADRLCPGVHREGLAPDLWGSRDLILLASGISAPFGSLLWGWAADKIGRRKAMIGTVLNTSIATGAMALTPEHAWIYLVICRLFVGFGVTGMYSVDITVIQEFVPTAKRGWLTGLTTTMLPAGFLLRRAAVGLCHTLYRLARAVCRRPAAGIFDPVHPRLGPQVAVLADAHGALRRGATVARLGIADRPQRHRPADP